MLKGTVGPRWLEIGYQYNKQQDEASWTSL
jgi:hypothetical protein